MSSATPTRPRQGARRGAPQGTGQQSAPQAPESEAGRGQGPVSFRLISRSGQFISFRLQQLVLIETAAAVLLAAWVTDELLLLPAVVVAAVLVLLAVARRHGRSLPEWIATARALTARKRQAANTPVPPGTEPGFAPAVECDPALRTYAYGDQERRPVGLVGDGTFLTAVLQVESDATALRNERHRQPLPLHLVRDALDVDDIRLESAQVVLHTQPAPALHLPQESVAVSNYAPLQAQTGAPAVRITWIALKLDPELCPEAVAARGGGLVGAQKCAVRSADHLASRLTGAGFRASVLSEEELHAAVATSACANPMVTAQAGRAEAPQRRTEETYRTWRCDNRRHTAYWVHRWPHFGRSGGPSLPQLIATITAIPALATTFSIVIGRAEHQGMTLRGFVRVSGRSDSELVSARRKLQQAARHTRTGLVRLDREQLPGVLATMPLGGTR